MSSFSGVMPKMARSIRASPSLSSSCNFSARSFSTISRVHLRNQPISKSTFTSSSFSSKRAFGLSNLNPWASQQKEEVLSPLVPADIGDHLPPSSFAAVAPSTTPASASLPSSASPAPTSQSAPSAPEVAAPVVEPPVSIADIEAYTSTLPPPPPSSSLQNLAPTSPNLPFMPPKGSNGVVGDQFLEPSQMADLAHVPIQIGDFKAMGLNGWFPTRLFQSIIEYIHVFTGLPWWATIVMATLLVRGTIAPMMVGNFRKAANMIVVAPQTKIYQDAMTKAKDEGDMATMTAVHKELTAHWKRHDCSPATLLVFPLVSIPLFMTMFFSVRAMADLPVPQLTVGGIPGWCLDLTAPDPTYILPVVAGGMTFLSMHMGISGIAPRFQPGNQQAITGVMKYISLIGIPVFGGFTVASWLPLIGGKVIGGFPAALVLYWATSNSFQVAQSLLLRTSWARNRFRLPASPTAETLGRPIISDWQAIKTGWNALNETSRKAAAKATTEAKAQQAANQRRKAAGGNTTSLDPEIALQHKRETEAAFQKASKEREELKRAQMLKSSKTLSEVVGGTTGGVLESHVVKGGVAKGMDAQGWTTTGTKKTSSAVKGMGSTKSVGGSGAAGAGGVQSELEALRARRKRAEEMLAAAKAAARAGKGKK